MSIDSFKDSKSCYKILFWLYVLFYRINSFFFTSLSQYIKQNNTCHFPETHQYSSEVSDGIRNTEEFQKCVTARCRQN